MTQFEGLEAVLWSGNPAKTVIHIPRILEESHYDPLFDQRGMLYMRYVDDEGNVVRVARIDPLGGGSIALYLTDTQGVFSGEAFHNIDDVSPRSSVPKEQVGDDVLVALLENKTAPEILAGYRPDVSLSIPTGSYLYNVARPRTFRIVELKEKAVQQ